MSRFLAALAVSLFAAASWAQDYPSKPITMIVPFPPGGVADIVGRPLAASMEKTLGQPVVVTNRTGAGGAVGMTAAAKAAPDGYTVLMTLSSISIFPVSDPINGKAAPYEIKDFAPIALLTADPTVLVVRADSPYRTIRDLVAELDPNLFWQVHRSTLVNLHAIAAVHRSVRGELTIRLKARPETLPVSAQHAHRFRQM